MRRLIIGIGLWTGLAIAVGVAIGMVLCAGVLPSLATELALKPKPGLPNPVLTPGESNPVLTKEKICGPGFRTGPFASCRQHSKPRSIALTACKITRERAPASGAVRSIISGASKLGVRIRARISGRSPTADDGTRSKRTPSKIVCISWSARARSN